MIDVSYTITVGNMLEVASILGGGLLVLVRLNNTVVGLKVDVSGMQTEIKKLADVITRMAVTDVRLTNLENDIRELRHGRGFIQGSRGIDHEYGGE